MASKYVRMLCGALYFTVICSSVGGGRPGAATRHRLPKKIIHVYVCTHIAYMFEITNQNNTDVHNMCVNYIYVYIYIYIYTCIHIYIYIYIYNGVCSAAGRPGTARSLPGPRPPPPAPADVKVDHVIVML